MTNKKALYPLVLVAVCSILLAGCASVEKNLGIAQFSAKRSVESNVFSSTFPELKLQVNREFKYLGSVPLVEAAEERLSFHADTAANLEATSYLFGQFDRENRLVKGVLVRVLVMQGDPSQVVPEIFTKISYPILESAEIKILEDRYQADLYAAPGFFTQKERELLGRGRMPPCFLVKQLSNKTGFGNKSRAQILYFEDVSDACGNRPCGACLDSANRTAEQRQFLQGFSDRSYANIRFLKTRTVEDTTSRYVDAEPKVQPAPAEQIQPRPVPPVDLAQPPVERAQPAPVERARPAPVAEKAPPAAAPAAEPSALEKRLEALKRIYDRDLITKEDYEKKKAELLKEL